MANILISYDLRETTKDIHKQVKDDMIAKGYSSNCAQKGVLPNTCLYKNTTLDASISDLKASVTKFKGTLERYVTVEFTNSKCDVLV